MDPFVGRMDHIPCLKIILGSCLAASLHEVDILHGVELLFVPLVSPWPGLLRPGSLVQYLRRETAQLVITLGTVRVAVTVGVRWQSRPPAQAQE